MIDLLMGSQLSSVHADGLCNCDLIIKPIEKPSEPTYLPVQTLNIHDAVQREVQGNSCKICKDEVI